MTRVYKRWPGVQVGTLTLGLLAACRGSVDTPARAECRQGRTQALVVCAESATLLHGVDVSKWQGSVDWTRVAGAGVQFGFARVSDGARTRDARFVSNFRGMGTAGIVRGAYQFFRPQQDPIEQAELMLSMLEEAGGLTSADLPPALDLEADDGIGIEDYRARSQTWLDHVQSRLGRRAIVYTGARFERFTGHALAGHPLWAPHYKSTYSGRCPNIAGGWSRWHFWQWSNMGRVTGIAGDVDRNVFDGSLEELSLLVQASIIGSPIGTWTTSDAGVSMADNATGRTDFDGGRDGGAASAEFADGAVTAGSGGLSEAADRAMGAAGLGSEADAVHGCLGALGDEGAFTNP